MVKVWSSCSSLLHNVGNSDANNNNINSYEEDEDNKNVIVTAVHSCKRENFHDELQKQIQPSLAREHMATNLVDVAAVASIYQTLNFE